MKKIDPEVFDKRIEKVLGRDQNLIDQYYEINARLFKKKHPNLKEYFDSFFKLIGDGAATFMFPYFIQSMNPTVHEDYMKIFDKYYGEFLRTLPVKVNTIAFYLI